MSLRPSVDTGGGQKGEASPRGDVGGDDGRYLDCVEGVDLPKSMEGNDGHYQDCVEVVTFPMSHVHNDDLADNTFQDCFEEHAEAAKDVETLAQDLLRVGDFSSESCRELAAKLCLWQGACKRRMLNGIGRAVALGAFTHGGIHGVINNTYNLKYTLRYLNKFLKFKGAKGRWSSMSVGLNTQPGVHRDAHNIDYNQTINLGPSRGGRLWVEDPKDEIFRRGPQH